MGSTLSSGEPLVRLFYDTNLVVVASNTMGFPLVPHEKLRFGVPSQKPTLAGCGVSYFCRVGSYIRRDFRCKITMKTEMSIKISVVDKGKETGQEGGRGAEKSPRKRPRELRKPVPHTDTERQKLRVENHS